ncbi:holo-ACP synthase [Prochlorococcus marinus]|uniref:holo-ACP synthase n=1 Tax=Prochlorococcus marinus TaxID=1219 RepID=UPI001C55CEFA|nr:4'-phosphopantetheinyl transferase superfamily protein [Prochlorococcus marinus]
MEKNIYKNLVEVIKQFPLNKNVKITEESKLWEVINLFSSLLAERVKVRLEEVFPQIEFEEITAETTIREILNSIEKNQTFPKNNKESSIEKDLNIYFDSSNNEQDHNSNEIGIGVDIQHLSSFPDDIFSSDNVNLRSSLFTELEVVYSLSRPDPKITLLGIYAAKEAVIKALNNKNKIQFNFIEIRHYSNGKPYVILKSYPKIFLEISISHSIDVAIGYCIKR